MPPHRCRSRSTMKFAAFDYRVRAARVAPSADRSEVDADDHRIVVRRSVWSGIVERVDLVRGLELDVVVEHGRLVGIDVPFGRASHLRRQRAEASACSRYPDSPLNTYE